MNKAILVGNITMDPKITSTEQGTVIANTSMATNEYYKDKHGEKQQITDFHNLVAFGRTAELFENHIKKGQKILVEGKIKTHSWEDKEGAKRYKTEIVVDRVEFMGSGKKDSPDNNKAIDLDAQGATSEEVGEIFP